MTTSLNRNIAPPIKQPELPKIMPNSIKRNHEITVFDISENEEISRFDIIFNIGKLHENKAGILKIVNSTILSGTSEKTEAEVNDSLDMLGIYHSIEQSLYETTITIFGTNALIKDAIPILIDAVFNASFPSDKINNAVKKAIAGLEQNKEKTSYLAKTLLNEIFYATKSIKNETTKEDFMAINQAELYEYYHQVFLKSSFYIIKPASVDLEKLHLPENTTIALGINKSYHFTRNIVPHTHIQKNDAVQTSIRGRCIAIGRQDMDYPILQLANTIWGGFFGALLMKNIREEKGLTYGISSYLSPNFDQGTIELSADISINNIDLVLSEIKKEIENLHQNTFDLDIFLKAKNYLLGNIAKSYDEIFANLEKYKLIYSEELPENYHQTYFESIKNCTLEKMTAVAKKYIRFDLFSFVTCGPEKQ